MQHRASIGIFYVKATRPKPKTVKKTKCVHLCSNGKYGINLLYILTFSSLLVSLATLLILAGDIHKNPGPQRSKELSIIHLNVRSLRNKIDILDIDANEYDIITLSETWLTEAIDSESLLLSGFSPPIRRDRNDGHGGVAIYVKNDQICRERPDLAIAGLEAIWIETKINQETLLVCSLYRPPNSRIDYWKLIEESIQKAFDSPHRFIILGDFNSDYLNNPSPHLLSLIKNYNLNQVVKNYTRITDNSSSCIDLILNPSNDLIKEVKVLPPICSDHMIPCAKLKLSNNTNRYAKKTIYNYSKLNKNVFLEELKGAVPPYF